MEAQGVTRMIEVGPGKVLAGMVKKISKAIEVTSLDDVPVLAQPS